MIKCQNTWNISLINSHVSSRGYKNGAVCVSVCVSVCLLALSWLNVWHSEEHLPKWPGVTCTSASVHFVQCMPLALIQVISLTVRVTCSRAGVHLAKCMEWSFFQVISGTDFARADKHWISREAREAHFTVHSQYVTKLQLSLGYECNSHFLIGISVEIAKSRWSEPPWLL